MITSLEVFEKQNQLKWLAHISIRKSIDTIKRLAIHDALNKGLGRKSKSVVEGAITATELSKPFYLKKYFK